MKKSLVLLACLFLMLSCCDAQRKGLASRYKNTAVGNPKYIPVEPYDSGVLIPVVRNDTLIEVPIHLATQAEKLSFLKNDDVLISISEVFANGSASWLGAVSFSSRNHSYRIVMDYCKYRSVKPNECGSGRVGVGLRLVASITTSKNKINLGDLFALGMAAEAGHLKGTLAIKVIGLQSQEITQAIPLPSELNRTTVQNAMMALHTIKARIHDPNTQVFPQVIGISPTKNNSDCRDRLEQDLGTVLLLSALSQGLAERM